MEYIAHLNEERTQTLKDHLCGTAELAGYFAGRFGKADWGYACGMLHDIGKYSLAFQDKIKNNSNRQVDHSTAGAATGRWTIRQPGRKHVLKRAGCTVL